MLRIQEEALTFDDVLLVPGYSAVTAKNVSLNTRLTRRIDLKIPLVSASMDTVTDSRLAIALAQEGGIGIIHKNMTIDQQALEVRAALPDVVVGVDQQDHVAIFTPRRDL